MVDNLLWIRIPVDFSPCVPSPARQTGAGRVMQYCLFAVSGSVLCECQSYYIGILLIHVKVAAEEACANCCLGSTTIKFIQGSNLILVARRAAVRMFPHHQLRWLSAPAELFPFAQATKAEALLARRKILLPDVGRKSF